jgi:DNA-binding MarR family transcriptional regulator
MTMSEHSHHHSAEPGDLADLLMGSARGLRRRWAESLEPWGLSPHHARALRVVADLQAPRLGVVAEHLRVTPRSATEVVDTLEERGLVERRSDPEDRRATCVVLTPEGARVRAEIDASRRTGGADYFSGLTAAERATLTELLTKLDPRRRLT